MIPKNGGLNITGPVIIPAPCPVEDRHGTWPKDATSECRGDYQLILKAGPKGLKPNMSTPTPGTLEKGGEESHGMGARRTVQKTFEGLLVANPV